jgi:signal transduction histidine kinase/DNA-binding response OmpR family regulator
MSNARTISWLIFFLLSVSLTGQKVYIVDTRYPVHDLMTALEYIHDAEDTLRSQDILYDSTLVFSPPASPPARLRVGSIYWGRISLLCDTALTGWSLHFEDRMRGTPAWTRSNGTVDVYAYSDGELLFHQQTGAAYPARERAATENWIVNKVGLDQLPPGQAVTLVVRISGNSFGFPPYFNASIRSPQQPAYHQLFAFDESFNLFLLGCTFIIFLYHLLQYVYLRQPLFLWFSVWVLFCCLTMAMSVGLLIGHIHHFRFPIWMLVANGVLYSFWFFGRVFVNSKAKYPRLDQFILFLSIAMLGEIVLTALYVVLFNPPTFVTGVGLHYPFIILYAICSVGASLYLLLKRDRFARYFGFGAMIFSVAAILGALWATGIWRPPFDPYAWGMFLQLIIYSFGIAYRQRTLLLQSQDDKLAAQQHYAEIQRLRDLDEIKTQFYTNLSHEFRTPLALIAGPLQVARKAQDSSAGHIRIATRTVDMISRNTERLQSLIDQLLELAKLESGEVHLKLGQGALIQFIKVVAHSFESIAESKGLSFNTSFPEDLPAAYFDPDKLEKIVSNLLSNAFKYTPAGGAVTLTVEHSNGYYVIEISDTGSGISTKEIKRIFERFYRAEGTEAKGSGIGLALVKELVDLHNGQISVSSRKGQGTTFKVRIPYLLELLPKHLRLEPDNPVPESASTGSVSVLGESPRAHLPSSSSSSSDADQLPLVLLVEDHPDLREHLAQVLEGHYQLLAAADGIHGERLAIEHIPDIIISDVMMPGKDGYQLCNDLKRNTKTSHIPIIMLTAKAGQQNKIEGLTLGADAYLTKPFDAEELLVRIKNLINNRMKLWEHFNTRELVVVRDVPIQSLEDQFLDQVLKIIRTNLDNEFFSVGELAQAVGFSRSQLNRKLKVICNKTPNQLIVEFRLHEAKRMLEQQVGTVSEIAYSVGYSNMSYFTKSFKAQFGVLPSKL